MVKKIILFLVLSIAFVLIFAFFLPKKNLFYFVQKELSSLHVTCNAKNIQENGYHLKIQNGILYIDGVDLLRWKESVSSIYLLHNKVILKGIHLSDLAKDFLPLNIQNIQLRYTVFDPLRLSLKGYGDFGKAQGYVDLIHKKVFLNVSPSQQMQRKYYKTLRYLHKDKQGEFQYEYNY